MRQSNQKLLGAFLILACLLAFVSGLDARAADAFPPESLVVVHTNGSIIAPSEVMDFGTTNRQQQRVHFGFGLPRKPCTRQWLEDGTFPICHTLWEEDGILYTQSVLVTRLAPGDLLLDGKIPDDAVLLVRIGGENLTNVYTAAKAELTVVLEGRPLSLHLRDGLVHLAEAHATKILAALDISPSGIVSTNGPRLAFAGNMPPANSGTMTIKFPFRQIQGKKEIEQLRDLDYEEEFQRVKRFWANRAKTEVLPVAFAKQKR